jgi:hypothetical protein
MLDLSRGSDRYRMSKNELETPTPKIETTKVETGADQESSGEEEQVRSDFDSLSKAYDDVQNKLVRLADRFGAQEDDPRVKALVREMEEINTEMDSIFEEMNEVPSEKEVVQDEEVENVEEAEVAEEEVVAEPEEVLGEAEIPAVAEEKVEQPKEIEQDVVTPEQKAEEREKKELSLLRKEQKNGIEITKALLREFSKRQGLRDFAIPPSLRQGLIETLKSIDDSATDKAEIKKNIGDLAGELDSIAEQILDSAKSGRQEVERVGNIDRLARLTGSASDWSRRGVQEPEVKAIGVKLGLAANVLKKYK